MAKQTESQPPNRRTPKSPPPAPMERVADGLLRFVIALLYSAGLAVFGWIAAAALAAWAFIRELI